MLQIKNIISESSDASYLTTTDRTGIYNSLPQPCSDNGPTGWGTENNADYTQATSGILQIKMPDPVTLLPQPNFYVIPSSGLNYVDIWTTTATRQPNVTKVPFQLLASTLGIGNCFPMGIYEFNITYGGSWGVTLYQWRMRVAFISQGCCCVKELQSKIECGQCESQDIEMWMKGVIALAAIESDMNCLKQQKCAEAVRRLMDICAYQKCKPCGF